MAGRGTDIKLTPEVKDAGGLAIIGTERHDSRRVDRQLRGRAGRQGDPGSSQFYVALDDNLMRIFGSERIAKMMDRMGLKEGEVIQHSMITKSIERAQKKVEENNFGIRKRLLEYDDIMNAQREFVYKRRKHALDGDRLKIDIANMIYDTCQAVVNQNKPTKDFQNFEFELIRFSSMTSPFSEEEFESMDEQALIDQLYEKIQEHYLDKIARSAVVAYPVIKDVYENEGDRYERIVVPFTDGVKDLQVVTNLKKAYETEVTLPPIELIETGPVTSVNLKLFNEVDNSTSPSKLDKLDALELKYTYCLLEISFSSQPLVCHFNLIELGILIKYFSLPNH
ncbi:predicted protein, partial [Nematostella vectensis]